MKTRITIVAALAGLLAACGSTASEDKDKNEDKTSSTTYTTVSDVDPHAAIGKDAEAARAAMEPAKEGNPVDWATVAKHVRDGGNSVKGDGSTRTIVGLVGDHAALTSLNAALDGSDAAATDAVRRQQVDKGITVLLAAKVIGELDTAAQKIADGNTDKAEGAPHNVDEAYAFFVAEGQGPASTADKRGADFGLDDTVGQAVVKGLIAAQKAAIDGDAQAFDAAAADVRSAVNYIFYLAAFKYLDFEDAEHQAEGASFYLAIAPALAEGAADAHSTVSAAYQTANADAARAALNSDAALTALGLSKDQAVSVDQLAE